MAHVRPDWQPSAARYIGCMPYCFTTFPPHLPAEGPLALWRMIFDRQEVNKYTAPGAKFVSRVRIGLNPGKRDAL
jgi:hypothetical protein